MCMAGKPHLDWFYRRSILFTELCDGSHETFKFLFLVCFLILPTAEHLTAPQRHSEVVTHSGWEREKTEPGWRRHLLETQTHPVPLWQPPCDSSCSLMITTSSDAPQIHRRRSQHVFFMCCLLFFKAVHTSGDWYRGVVSLYYILIHF